MVMFAELFLDEFQFWI